MFNDSAWSWSLYLFTFRGIAVRAHWSVLVMALHDALSHWQRGAPLWMIPVLPLILLGSILLHEFGHSFAARAVGGFSDRIVLWMLGGLAECQAPTRPWPQFAVAAAGPLVSLALAVVGFTALILLGAIHLDALGSWTIFMQWPLRLTGSALPDAGIVLLGYLGMLNLRLLLFNLLPCYPLDGGRMFLTTVWPVFGMRRAMISCLVVGYPIIIALFILAMLAPRPQVVGVFLSIWLMIALVQEHTQLITYGAYAFGLDLTYDRPAWWDVTQRRRHRQREEARQQAEEAEMELVDKLLEKVGKQGLASLTRHERAVLEAYSRKQRDRTGSGLD